MEKRIFSAVIQISTRAMTVPVTRFFFLGMMIERGISKKPCLREGNIILGNKLTDGLVDLITGANVKGLVPTARALGGVLHAETRERNAP